MRRRSGRARARELREADKALAALWEESRRRYGAAHSRTDREGADRARRTMDVLRRARNLIRGGIERIEA